MASKNTHSISIRGTTHQRLQGYCDAEGVPMYPTVEAWLHEFAPFTDRQPAPLARHKGNRFVPPEPPEYEDDLPPVEREREPEVKGSDIVEPDANGLVPFQKKAVRGGGYNEF